MRNTDELAAQVRAGIVIGWRGEPAHSALVTLVARLDAADDMRDQRDNARYREIALTKELDALKDTCEAEVIDG